MGLFGWFAKAAANAAFDAVGNVIENALDKQGERNRIALLWPQLNKIVAEHQHEADLDVMAQREAGHKIPRAEMWAWSFFDGKQALIRFQEGGERGRMDIFYGGQGEPDGDLHGHVITRSGKVVFWALPGANGQDRHRVV